MNRMLIILRRELKELRRNRTFFQTMAIFPVVMVVLPMVVILIFNSAATDFGVQNSPDPTNCEQVGGLAGCNKAEIVAGIIATSFSFFLPVPVVLPMVIAAYSVVGEKERKSLEPLLATPVRTSELLLGKSLSAIVPATVLCWGGFVLLVLILRVSLPEAVFARTQVIDLVVWLLTIGLWTPLLAFVTTMVGVSISARVQDARAAQQYGSLMALPVVALVIGISLGLFKMTWGLWGAGLLVLSVVSYIAYRLALGMFEREAILTRWK